jgi:hypothetical protein
MSASAHGGRNVRATASNGTTVKSGSVHGWENGRATPSSETRVMFCLCKQRHKFSEIPSDESVNIFLSAHNWDETNELFRKKAA